MIRGILSLGTLALLTVVLGLPALVIALVYPRSFAVMRFGRFWARGTLAVMGVRGSYSGLEHLESLRRGQPTVLVANHMSLADVLLLVAILPLNIHFVAKESLFRIPFFGMLLRAANYIPIDRTNRQRAIRSLKRAAERIRGGDPVLVFAEGTRSRDGRLQPFKKGAFHLALQASAPVLPVAISGTWQIIRPSEIRVQPGAARVSFGKPIPIDPYLPSDLNGLLGEVRQAIAGRLAPEEVHPSDWGQEAQAR